MGKRIEFSFVGDTADLERSLRAVQGEGRDAGDAMEEGGKRGAAGLSKAEKASKALKAGLLAVTAGAVAAAAATGAIVKAAVEFAARADTIAKKAKAIGTSAEELQLLTGALALGGVAAETTAASIQKLQVNLGLAAKGGKLQREALEALRLTSEQLESVPLEERIALIADGLGRMTSQSARAQTAQALLGRGALDMLAAFTDGGDAIRDSTALIRDAGIISNQTAVEGERLTDAVALLAQQLGHLRDEMLTPLLPVLTTLADRMRETLDELDPSGFTALGDAAKVALLEVIAPAVITVGAEVSKAFLGMKATIKGVEFAFDALSSVATAGVRSLLAVAAAATGDTERAFELMSGGVAKAIESFREFDDASAEVGSALGAVDDTADKLRAALKVTAEEIAQATLDADLMAIAFGDEVEPAAGRAAEAIDEVGRAAAEAKDDVKDLASAFDDLISVTHDAFEAELDAADRMRDLEEEDAERKEERAEVEAERRKEAAQEAIDLAGQVADETFNLIQQAAAAEVSARVAAAERTKSRITAIEDAITNAATEGERTRLEAQKATLLERSEAEKAEALEAWNRQQALAVGSAVVSAALAVISQLTLLPAPAGIAASIAAGIAGGVAVATIAAQPPPQFHSGGMIGAAGVHDEVMIRARAGEAVLSPQGVAAAGGAGGVGALNAGGGAGGGRNVTVFQVGHRAVDAMVHESLRRPGGRLSRELRAVRPRRVGRYNPWRS